MNELLHRGKFYFLSIIIGNNSFQRKQTKQKQSVMSLYLITAIFEIICVAIASYALPITDENGAALYLKKFGYLDESANALRRRHTVSTAIKDFQRFAGLSETGELNNDTIRLMNAPRCGVKDKTTRSQSIRKKRYALQGSRWPVKELTYHVSQHTSRIRDSPRAMNEIARALKIWSDVTSLNFKEKLEGPVDIDIRFVVGQHEDGDPFDGPGETLAHAFFPQYGGDAHFDDEEMWTLNEKIGTNLFQVAAHEFGHSLGLLHSDVQSALMYPFYQGYVPGFQLHSDDIEGIQALYGARYSPPPTDDEDDENLDPPSDTSDAPDLCQDATIDAITRTKSGSTYVFKGNFYWKVLDGIPEGYPRKISDDWDGLEGNLDASVTWNNGKTFFFKENRYWSFTNTKMDSGYPKFISEGFKGIPDNLDAALVWSGNGKTYFFKGDKYWRYDIDSVPPVKSDYPMSIREWSRRFLATGIDAALQWENRRTYLFKGDQYYRYNDNASEIDVDPAYPLSTARYWFNCQ